MKIVKAVLDTGIFEAHLGAESGKPTALRKSLRTWFCYTTVFNAMEILGKVRTPRQQRLVEDVLSSVKILGMNGRNAGKFARIAGPGGGAIDPSALVAGICIEAHLPLVTSRPGRYKRYRKLRIIAPPGNVDKR